MNAAYNSHWHERKLPDNSWGGLLYSISKSRGWKVQKEMICHQQGSCGHLIIRFFFHAASYGTFKVKVIMYQKNFIGRVSPVIPPQFTSCTLFRWVSGWDSHRCFSGDCEPLCRHGQAIMQWTNHLASATPISFFFFCQVKMRWCILWWCADMAWLMVVKTTTTTTTIMIVLFCQDLLNDGYNTDHPIITDTDYKVGG